MQLSARNQYTGRVVSITRGGVVAEVTVDIGHGQEIVSVITNGVAGTLTGRVGRRLRSADRTESTPELNDSAPPNSFQPVLADTRQP
jgi:molybdopterin-binding protein